MTLFADIVGLFGMTSVVLAYILIQLERISPLGLLYNSLNLVGACLLFVSLCINFNLASLVIELFWISASLVGLARYVKRRQPPKPTTKHPMAKP